MTTYISPKCAQTLPNVLSGAKSPLVETTALRQLWGCPCPHTVRHLSQETVQIETHGVWRPLLGWQCRAGGRNPTSPLLFLGLGHCLLSLCLVWHMVDLGVTDGDSVPSGAVMKIKHLINMSHDDYFICLATVAS